ncbi:MAG TPA: helix-turn-helix transcriptional regulator [Gaiellaceae bacterium]|nr:helix-turn-helix transcriptional regulator [Gaiellaceae bacterium]
MARGDDPQLALGAAIRELRTRRSVTQEDLAHDAGVTVGTLSLIERGQSNPAWGTVKRIAAALDTKVSDLAKRAERAGG